jgi:CrcB protein
VPLAVAAVNIIGCFAIGLLAGAVATERWSPTVATRAFVFVGLLGGFTTFSSFGLDVLTLVQQGKPAVAVVNVVGQVFGGLLAVFVGYGLVVAIGSR